MKKQMSRAKLRASRNSKATAFMDPRLHATKAFGGTLFRKARYRKSRPLSTKHPIHLVLRSSQAKGAQSFQSPKNWKLIEKLCFEFATRYGIKLEQFMNGGSHLHLIIRLKNRLHYATFIRALTGAIALKITGANRNQANPTKFWDFRPFTQIKQEGPQALKDYVTLNLLKSLKVLPTFKNNSIPKWPLTTQLPNTC